MFALDVDRCVVCVCVCLCILLTYAHLEFKDKERQSHNTWVFLLKYNRPLRLEKKAIVSCASSSSSVWHSQLEHNRPVQNHSTKLVWWLQKVFSCFECNHYTLANCQQLTRVLLQESLMSIWQSVLPPPSFERKVLNLAHIIQGEMNTQNHAIYYICTFISTSHDD